jgi:hypothetical protein
MSLESRILIFESWKFWSFESRIFGFYSREPNFVVQLRNSSKTLEFTKESKTRLLKLD